MERVASSAVDAAGTGGSKPSPDDNGECAGAQVGVLICHVSWWVTHVTQVILMREVQQGQRSRRRRRERH